MAVDSIARMLAADASDIAEQAMKTIIEFPQGFNYKGEVDYFSDLPTTGNTVGDVYTVKYKGSSGTDPLGDEYVWGEYQGVEQWILRSNLSQYAKIDGSYILMNVGTSDNLVDKKAVGSLQSPFLFRPTAGGDISINGDGTAQIKSVHGNTLVWNQMIENGDFQSNTHWTKVGDGTRTTADGVMSYVQDGITSSEGIYYNSTNDRLISGHKYLLSIYARLSDASDIDYSAPYFSTSKFTLVSGTSTSKLTTDFRNYSAIVSANSDYDNLNYLIGVRAAQRADAGVTLQIKSANAFDLTVKFGAGNEPATVADFREWLSREFYPFSAPRLLNFTGTGIKSVGFNQWDEEWELGTYKSEDGKKSSNTSKIRNKNPIRVISGETYYIKASTTVTAFYYRADGTYIRYKSISKNATFIVPEETAFMNWTTGSSSDPVTTYNNDICINLSHSGDRNGEYEAYWSETRQLPTATYFPGGMKSAGSVYDELTPDKAITRIDSRAYEEGDENDPTVITDGTTTLYPLATPTEVAIDPPLNLSYRAADFGTEEVITPAGTAPTSSPLVMKAHYNRDYTRQLDNIADNIGDGAEAGALAESAQAVSAGRLLMGGFDSDEHATLKDSQIRADIAKAVVEAVYNAPTADGVYMFKATVTDGVSTFSWEAAE